MKLKLEDWTSLASLGLSVMFIVLLLSFYNFLIGPQGQGPERVVDPGSLILQLVFISAAPCLVLAGFVFGMARTYGTQVGGISLLAAGIVITAGMIAGIPMLQEIPNQYVVGAVGVAPYFFIAAGVGVTAVGGYLLAMSRKKKISNSLDDLR
jgi:hypothetical protein